ncbi:MAG: tRNA (adenosine(37)-N6)-dimethylallyltransferase MiaA [Porticoccaceae bacterium]|nr:tRNA (adenosine(37)-N6)-dimethylallyltransferase MiaA [Porticoccaceae bacterium]OUS04068.1 tRNA (adenosine(37)-N6)-dimethylallyltransferase MiaA [Gammaproteobacteria bacterium 54_18_T64]
MVDELVSDKSVLAQAAADQRPPVIFLLGPTASGKTDLALQLCKILPCDIISVDSSQVYRGMDIGTAKPEAEVLSESPHRLINICDPAEAYSVGEFLRDARREIDEISAAGRIPLLVGGTMLYFKALREGLADLPPANGRVRAEIEQQAAAQGWPFVHALLAEVDPEGAAAIHPNHSQRIARALEVYRVSGQSLSQLIQQQLEKGCGVPPLDKDYRIVQLALIPTDRAALHRRIEQRFTAMLDQGFVDEVKALRQRGDLSTDLPAVRAVGYRQIWAYLDGDCTYEEMQARGVASTRQLAKRQLTWLRGWADLHRLELSFTEADSSRCDEDILLKALAILQSSAIYKNPAG